MKISEAMSLLEEIKNDIGDVEILVDMPNFQKYGWIKNIIWSSLQKEVYLLVLTEDAENQLREMNKRPDPTPHTVF